MYKNGVRRSYTLLKKDDSITYALNFNNIFINVFMKIFFSNFLLLFKKFFFLSLITVKNNFLYLFDNNFPAMRLSMCTQQYHLSILDKYLSVYQPMSLSVSVMSTNNLTTEKCSSHNSTNMEHLKN